MTTSMVKVLRAGLMAANMQATTDRARNTVKGSTSGRTAVTTMEIGKITRSLVMEYISGQMAENTSEIG